MDSIFTNYKHGDKVSIDGRTATVVGTYYNSTMKDKVQVMFDDTTYTSDHQFDIINILDID